MAKQNMTVLQCAIPCFIGAALVLFTVGSRAADGNDVVDGDIGVLYVSGELVRGACNIENDSAHQTIDLGTISSGELTHVGDTTEGRKIHLRLRDCIDGQVAERDKQNGVEVRIEREPQALVSFESVRDDNDPALVAVRGASGFGLRLEDNWHHQLTPGGPGEPLKLVSGSNELTYRLRPERTIAPFQYGNWQSMVYIKFSYE